MMVDYVDDGSKRLVFSSIRVILTERERERERDKQDHNLVRIETLIQMTQNHP